MTILPNLSADERLAAARKFKREATPENKAVIMALRGETGNTFVPPKHTDNEGRAPRGWEPRVTYSPLGLPEQIYSPAVPADLPEAKALADTLEIMNAMVPVGYRARIAEVRLDTAGWQRKMADTEDDESGRGEAGTGIGDAFTGAVRRYKWLVEPIPEAEEIVAGLSEEEWNTVVARVSKRKYKTPKVINLPQAVDLFVPHGDLQAGQGDGDSVEGLIARMSLYPIIVKAEIARLKKTGVPVKRIVCPSLGDLVEGLDGSWYSNQTWLVNLNEKKQRLVARRLIQAMLEEIATIGLPMLVPVVPGNHGENRRKGKMISDASDNFDLEVMEVIAEIFAQNPVLKEQVKFVFVDDGMQTLTMDLGFGYGVGFTHGHLSGHGSGHPAAKMTAYLKGQALSEQPIGRARFIISGHFHSAMYVTIPGGKTWIQIPAACDESVHFKESYGLSGGPGFITFTLGADGLSNWMEHKVPTLSTVDADIVDAKAALAARKAA
jgi:hypothetical protein